MPEITRDANDYMNSGEVENLKVQETIVYEGFEAAENVGLYLTVGVEGVTTVSRVPGSSAQWEDTDTLSVGLNTTPNALLSVTPDAVLYKDDTSYNIVGKLDNTNVTEETVSIKIIVGGVEKKVHTVVLAGDVTGKVFSVGGSVLDGVDANTLITITFEATNSGINLRGNLTPTTFTLTKVLNLAIDSTLKFNDKLGVDVDTITTLGRYEVDTNLPFGIPKGQLEVIGVVNNLTTPDMVYQRISDLSAANQYYRDSVLGDGSDWTAWAATGITERLEALETPISVSFEPQDPAPAYKEGQLFYDDVAKTLTFQNDVDGVNLNIGQEQHIRVYNNTGADIINGEAVRMTGATGGVPVAALAMANLYSTASVMGIATHTIPTGTIGLVTTFGSVGGMDTSGYAVGEVLNLSDTIPGGYTLDAPDILSSIGVVLFSDALEGRVFASISNLKVIPTIGAFMQDIPTPIDIGAVGVPFTGFQVINASGAIQTTTDSMLIPIAGTYKIFAVVSLNGLTPDANGSIVYLEIFDKTSQTVLFTFNATVGRNDAVTSAGFPLQWDLAAGVELQLRHRTSATHNGTNIGGISFGIDSAHLR